MFANITCLISAGCVAEEDNKIMIVRGLDDDTAQHIANWLAVATNGPVCLRHMNIMKGVDRLIQSKPETIEWKKLEPS